MFIFAPDNQKSCISLIISIVVSTVFIYGNDLAKVRLLLPALLCIMVQTTLALAKIWYLFDNAKYFSSHVRYNHKISCISEEIENVQKWTFSIAISISPKSIIALKRLTLLAFRNSSNVISAFCIIPLSNSLCHRKSWRTFLSFYRWNKSRPIRTLH